MLQKDNLTGYEPLSPQSSKLGFRWEESFKNYLAVSENFQNDIFSICYLIWKYLSGLKLCVYSKCKFNLSESNSDLFFPNGILPYGMR